VAALMGDELGWSPARLTQEVDGYEARVDRDLARAGLERVR